MGRADVYVQPEAKDPVLSHPSVLKIAATHTDRAGAVLEVDESGGEARAYLLEGDVVVKTQRPHRLRPRTSLAKEAALLDHVAASIGGQVPHLFGRGRTVVPEGEVEYLVMSRMPGRAVRHLTVMGETRAPLLRATGALIARLHAACDTAALAAGGHFPQDHDGADLLRRLESGFADLTEEIASHPGCWTLPVTPEQAAARALALIPAEFAAAALHSNPGPTHVFADDAGTLTGVIDFGDAYISHPAMDLRTWPDPADRLTVREGYLAGREPEPGFEAAWTAAMIYTDMAVIASRPHLAQAAAEDLTVRLAA